MLFGGFLVDLVAGQLLESHQGFQKKVVGGVGMIKPWLIIIIMVHDHDDNDDKTLKTEAAAAS